VSPTLITLPPHRIDVVAARHGTDNNNKNAIISGGASTHLDEGKWPEVGLSRQPKREVYMLSFM